MFFLEQVTCPDVSYAVLSVPDLAPLEMSAIDPNPSLAELVVVPTTAPAWAAA